MGLQRRNVLTLIALCTLCAATPRGVAAQQSGGQQQKASSSSSAAGGQCIPPDAVQELEECPADAPKRREGENAPQARSTDGGEAQSHLSEAERKDDGKGDSGPTGPSIDLSTEERMNREEVQQRAWNLLRKEVRVLKRLVDNTRQDDPRRPDILLRLAETLFEMQQFVRQRVRAFDQPIYEACTQNEQGQKCRQLKQQQQQTKEQLGKLRQETIRTYAILVQDHQNYRRMDEVLFALAFGLEQMDQMDRARQVYHRLIKGFPQSDFIPHAYLSFAEYYFNEGDMAPALQFYEKVTEFPPERNPVYGYALYKSAWAHFNQESFRDSLQAFVEVIEFAQQNPDANDAENLGRQARNELVMPYARVGSPGRALNFFRRYAKNEQKALEMLESLAELYFDTGEWSNTIAVYHELMAEAPEGDELCKWQARVTDAVISSKPKDDQVTEMERMVDVFDKFSKGDHPAEKIKQCKREAATVLVTQATAWHRETIGTDSQPGTNDRRTMNLAARVYRTLLDKFPDMEQMKFPAINEDDWPTQYKISYYHAELLWKMEEWARCGPAFDKVVELNPQGKYTSDAAYAAVLCYNNLYQQQYSERQTEVEEHQDDEGFAPREFTKLEKGMMEAFRRYICYVPESEDLATIKYRRARIYYEANHWEEAALLFKDIAFNHVDSDLSVYAANLYLDSLNILGSKMEDAKTSCILEIKDNIEPMWGNYCNTPDKESSNAELCGVLEQLRCDVLRKEAESYQTNDKFKKAASTYVRIFRKYRECGNLDEVLFNAAINFEAAKLLGNAIKVRGVLIDKFPESELAKKAIYLLGSNWHAIAVYDKAAEYYEQFARKFPGEDGEDCSDADKAAGLCPVAHEALTNAVFFRLGLGDEEEAVEDAELFEKNYRRRMPKETARVKFAVGSIYERQNAYNKIVDHYRSFLRRYRRGAEPHQKLQANIKIARSYWERDDRRRAKKYLKTISRYWTRRNPAEKILGAEGGSQRQKINNLREAIDATAEALFYEAEYDYTEFQRIPFPEYEGSGDLEDVQEWSEGEFKEWVEEKMEALRKAEAAYNKVAEVKVEVEGVELQSPPWQIAAAARVGEMYDGFVKTFRDAPIPNQVKNDPELRDIYLGALDKQSEPLVKKAKASFSFCLQTATNVRWFNEWSEKCELKLNELDPKEYPIAGEISGEATYIQRTPAPPEPVGLGSDEDEAGLGGSTPPTGEDDEGGES